MTTHVRRGLASILVALLAVTGVGILRADAAVVFQQAATGMTNPTGGNAATALAIAKPAGLAEGDFMLAQVTFEKGSDAGTNTQLTPTGWTLIVRHNSGTDIGQAVFRKFATASDVSATSFTFPFIQSVKAAGSILRYTGVDTTSPVIASGGSSGTSGNLVAPTVNAEANSMLVTLYGLKKANTTISVPAGMTGRVDFQNPQDVKIRAFDEARTSAGLTGTRTATPSVQEKWVAQAVTLRQAVVVVPPNNAPVYTEAATQSAITGQSASIGLGSFSDTDNHASWTVHVNWGDSSSDQYTRTATGNIGTAAHTYASAGAKTVTVHVSDGVDNSNTETFTVNVSDPDTAAPAIVFDATGDYAPNGTSDWWKSGTAKVKVTATDASGVASLTCTLAGEAVTLTNTGSSATQRWGDVEMATDGSRQVACSASDGTNATASGSEVTHQLKRDTVAPAVTVTGVSDGGSYAIGTAAAGCNTTDTGGSGVATPASIQEPAPDHSTAGSKTATCAGAVDSAGNSADAVDADYTIVAVTYSAVFGQPLDMGGTLNSTKLGRVVPVKVKVLGSDGGYDRSGPVSHQTRKIQCATGSSVDTIEQTLMAGSSNTGNAFRWDATGDHWIFNLDTGKIGARVNDCYQLDVYRGGTLSSTGTVSGGTYIGSVKLTFTK